MTDLHVVPKRRRSYDAKTKGRAVGIATVEGATEASRRTGIPKVTIWQWLQDPAYEQLRTRAREDVTSEWWSGIQMGARHLVAGITDPSVALRDKSQAFLALAQNYLLLSGQATTRTETNNITNKLAELKDHESDALADLLDKWREEEKAALTAEEVERRIT